MKILLITPPAHHQGKKTLVVPPLGLAQIAAVLRRAGYRVTIKDAYAEGLGWDAFATYLASERPDILGLTGISPLIDTAFRAIHLARPYAGSIIMGGPHISVWGSEVFRQCPELDLGIVGEGEETSVDLVAALARGDSPEGIPGVIGRDFVGPAREMVQDLDALPFPARDLLPLNHYSYPLSKSKRVTTLFTSRGCPYQCIFCDKSVFGSRWRGRSSENILAEIDEIVQHYRINSLVIYDDLFTLDKMRVQQICEGILRRGYKLDWKCEGRVNLIDLETLKLMKRAGCSLIAYGVESGNQPGLDYLKKNITLDQIRRAFALTHQAGIETLAYFLLGIPNETYQDEIRTIRLACEINPTYAQFAFLSPYYGTRLYEEAKLEGWHQDFAGKDSMDQDLKRPAMISPNWDEAKLHQIMRRAHFSFYLRPSYVFKRMATVKSPAHFFNALKGFLALARWVIK